VRTTQADTAATVPMTVRATAETTVLTGGRATT